MASKQFPYQNNFNTGEISPRFEARSEVSKFYSALKRLINFLPFSQGGVTRRPGLQFGRNNFCDLQGRILPFKFTRDVDSNFIVHLCDERLHVTDDNGNEIETSPFLTLECEEVIDSGTFFDVSDPLTSCAIMDCRVGSPHLNFRAIGGVPPFSWSIVGSGPLPLLTITGGDNEFVTVDPPVNLPGGPVGGVAYEKKGFHVGCTSSTDNCKRPDCDNGTCGNCAVVSSTVVPFFCDGTVGTVNVGQCGLGTDVTNIGEELRSDNARCSLCPPVELFPPDDTGILVNTSRGELVDLRTPGMIAAGCGPCGVSVNESILTLTDDLGTMISVALVAVT